MKNIPLFLLAILILTNCNNGTNQDKRPENGSRTELIPEPHKAEQLKKTGCSFDDPDSSLSGINIRNSESTTKVIGNNNKLDDVEQYHFYTKLYRETLTLTQQPSDGKNQISVFKVEYSGKADYGYRQLPIDTLKTEKGIRLGLTKKQIIEKLGTCYAAIDSSRSYIELYYRIELPEDSRTGLLMTHNMPVYYASYKLWHDRLEQFEFGFEYP